VELVEQLNTLTPNIHWVELALQLLFLFHVLLIHVLTALLVQVMLLVQLVERVPILFAEEQSWPLILFLEYAPRPRTLNHVLLNVMACATDNAFKISTVTIMDVTIARQQTVHVFQFVPRLLFLLLSSRHFKKAAEEAVELSLGKHIHVKSPRPMLLLLIN
jgi:hypothetical protein